MAMSFMVVLGAILNSHETTPEGPKLVSRNLMTILGVAFLMIAGMLPFHCLSFGCYKEQERVLQPNSITEVWYLGTKANVRRILLPTGSILGVVLLIVYKYK